MRTGVAGKAVAKARVVLAAGCPEAPAAAMDVETMGEAVEATPTAAAMAAAEDGTRMGPE